MENSELTTGSASPLPLCLKLDADQVLFEPLGQVHAGIVWAMPSRMARRLVEFSITPTITLTTTNTAPIVQTVMVAQSARVQISRSVRLVNKPENGHWVPLFQ
jgi:hypothetical protein